MIDKDKEIINDAMGRLRPVMEAGGKFTGGEKTLEGFDNVVLATGVQPRNELVKEIEAVVKEVYVIGDAAEPRKSLEAMREGTETGRKI